MCKYTRQVKWLEELSGKTPITTDETSYIEFIPSRWTKSHMGARVVIKRSADNPKIIYLDASGNPNGYWDFWHYESAGTKQLVKEVVNEAYLEAHGTPKFKELG